MNNAKNITNLSLYHFEACPYCARTRQSIQHLELDIPKYDIRSNPAKRTELIRKGGLGQVPCLKIETSDGNTEWLYESSDIIKYLNNNADIIRKQAQQYA